MAYDYTGYGLDKNNPSEPNTYMDIENVIAFAVIHFKHKLKKIILCGFSLGSGPTVDLAVKYPSIAFVMLFAPLASSLYMLEKTDKEISHTHDIFANVDKIGKLKSDVIIVHGTEDKTIPLKHAEMLVQKYESSHNETDHRYWFIRVDGADHNELINCFDTGDSVYKTTFLEYFDFLLEKNGLITFPEDNPPLESKVIEEK
jgi:fermentation-respiration switch protein FrsA (DUF1100 family)